MFLIIDNYDSFTFNLYQLFAELVKDVQVFRNDVLSVAEIQAMQPSALILSPGPGRPENAGICVDVIKQLYQRIPILGVCLGHQAIGYAFGAKIIHAPKVLHGKASPIFHGRKSLYQYLPLPFSAGRYHSLIIERSTLSAEFVVQAEDADGEIMGIKHNQFPLYGVQFHPESILTPDGKKLISNFIGEIGILP